MTMSALWPYGLHTALLAIPVVWLLAILILSVTGRLAAWPPPEARPLVLVVTLVVSLIPLALRLLDVARGRWDIGGGQSAALAEIHRNRVNYEAMASRTSGTPAAAVTKAIDRFDELVTEALAAKDGKMLDALVEESEMLAQRRAFICPKENITAEAKSHLISLEDWGLPAKTIGAIKDAAAPALDVKDVNAAQGALHLIFEEYDRWNSYMREYNMKTSFWASTALTLIAVLATGALFMMFGWSWRVLALVCAAVAGASASVIARLPGLTSYGEWKVNLRAYQARIGTGIVGSLVGIGLLGSGLITITLPGQWKSADLLLDACLSAPSTTSVESSAQTPGSEAAAAAPAGSAAAPVPCKGGGLLFVLALTMLLGFSERLLTTLEGKVTGASAGAANPPKS